MNKSKAGKVYIGEVTFRNGKKVLYTGQTRRSVYKRVGEHMRNQYTRNTKTYVGKGVFFRLLGSVFSNNRFKAEKTVKKLSVNQKRGLVRKGEKNKE